MFVDAYKLLSAKVASNGVSDTPRVLLTVDHQERCRLDHPFSDGNKRIGSFRCCAGAAPVSATARMASTSSRRACRRRAGAALVEFLHCLDKNKRLVRSDGTARLMTSP